MRNLADSSPNRVRAVIEAASRRRNTVCALDQLPISLALVSAGAILTLLLGTEILNWRWLMLLATVGVIAGTWRVRRLIVGRYRVAQLVDRRLQLQDSLSTAWFLLEHESLQEGSFAREQIRRAEETARTLDIAAVFPLGAQRAWAFAGALVAVAFGLFAVRYLVTSSLDFKQALVPLPFPLIEQAIERLESPLSNHDLASAINHSELAHRNGDRPAVHGNQKNPSKEEHAAELASGKPNRTDGSQKSGTKTGNTGQSAGSDERSKADAFGPRQPDNAAQQNAAAETGQKPSQAGEPQAQNGPQQDSSGLVDKMKDALSSLMAKMRPQESGNKPNETGRASQGPSGNQQSAQSNSRDAQTAQNPQNSQTGREQKAEGQSPGDATEKSPGSQTRASGDSASAKGSDAHSGVGRQDGDKAATEAEQLRAMGKLAEIIGKRSADLTGDITVETGSGRQQLKTQYSGRIGRHADLGGEIDHSEVPPELRSYVREYMEQVRKQTNDH